MIRTVKLYGHLRDRFGASFHLDVATPGEAIRALCSQLRGFKQHILGHAEPGYRVLLGDCALGVDELHAPCGGSDISIVPVMAGAGDDPLTNILVGGLLILASFYVPVDYAWLANGMAGVGYGMALGGVSQLLAKAPPIAPLPGDRGPADTPTYAFGGPHMTIGQGNPVPLVFGGPIRVGGALISMGSSQETWPDKGLGGAAADNSGTVAGNGDTSPFVWAIGPQ